MPLSVFFLISALRRKIFTSNQLEFDSNLFKLTAKNLRFLR